MSQKKLQNARHDALGARVGLYAMCCSVGLDTYGTYIVQGPPNQTMKCVHE